MTTIVWNLPDDVRYEDGLDRGVLYPLDSQGVPWNGLISVQEEYQDTQSFAFYHDGVKRTHHVLSGTFSGTITAYGVPDAFLQIDGVTEFPGVGGVFLKNQPNKTFHLSYRTLDKGVPGGDGDGYKLHLLYNLIAYPSSVSRKTGTDKVAPNVLSWTVKGVPLTLPNMRPSSHIIVNSRYTAEANLTAIEDILYGTVGVAPRMVTHDELYLMIEP